MIKPDWEEIGKNEIEQFEKMTELQKYQYFLMLQYNSPYGWGEENPESSDCSGGVCLALTAATGILIRTTADELFKKYFTKDTPSQSTIRAAFWITMVEKNHGGSIVPPGTAVHIAGIVGNGACLSAEDNGSVVRSIDSLSLPECRVLIRGLDRDKLRSGLVTYGIDANFWRYFKNE